MNKWLKISLGTLVLVGIISLMSLANKQQKQKELANPEILIHIAGEHAFLTEHELFVRLKRKGFVYTGLKQSGLQVAKIESFIRKMTEVKDVKVYTYIGSQWKIDVTVRKPIARIYNQYDENYYLDEDGVIMRPSSSHTARVVVVTGFIPDKINAPSVAEIINNDTLKSIQKLDDVYRISNYVCNDPLLQSLIGQIHLKKDGNFVLIPLVGRQKIVFGSAYSDEEVKLKMNKLKIFYKEGMPYEGWNKYDLINLKYKKQIVCRKAETFTEEN
jgi:cell division protein FtsQ